MMIQPSQMTLEDLRSVWRNPTQITLAPSAYAAIHASAQAVDAIVARDLPAYGINTGFGLLAKKRIAIASYISP